MFREFDYVVAPSASCAAFVKVFYPAFLKVSTSASPPGKIMDVVEFLHDVLKVMTVPGTFPHVVSVHNSCHGVRELGLSSPSERNIPPFNKIIDLLRLVPDITVKSPERKDECCGFGGMFSVEETDVCPYGHRQTQSAISPRVREYITGPDSSCLMHMQV